MALAIADAMASGIVSATSNWDDAVQGAYVDAYAAGDAMLVAGNELARLLSILLEWGSEKPSLSQRMLDAADTLEEVSRLYDYGNNASRAAWSADTLRHEAQHVESEE